MTADLIQARALVPTPPAALTAHPLALLASSALTLCEAVALLPLLHALRQRKAVMLCLREAGEDAAAGRVWRAAQRALSLIEQRRTAEAADLSARLKDLQEAG